MEVKPGHKLTEVGVIPEDWECCPISSVAQLESGHTPSKRKKSYWDGAVGWVSLHDTARLDGNEIHTTTRTITEEGVKNSSARMLPKGTVIFSRTATVGKSTALGRDMATSQDFANYICGPNLNSLFLVYLFRSMKRTWAALMAGSIHNTIYMPTFKSLQIARPPIGEQRAIAKALSDVDALLGALDRLIAKKRDLKHAAMQQLLTGKTRLPGFNGVWESVVLGDIGECVIGLTYQPRNVVDDGLLVLRSSNIQNGRIDFDDKVQVNVGVAEKLMTREGDILVCVRNGSRRLIGKSATIRRDSENHTFGAFMSIFRTRQWRFLEHAFAGSGIQRQIRENIGATINQITNKDMNAFTLDLPPSEEQLAIAEVLSEMDDEITGLESRRQKTRQLKQGMMQELLTGKTRLVKPETRDV